MYFQAILCLSCIPLGAGGISSGAVEEILTLVGDDVDNMIKSMSWVTHLEADLQPVACEALYEKIKLKHYTDQPILMLPLFKYVSEVPVGLLDDVRSELESDCDTFIDAFVKTILKGDYKDDKNCQAIERFDLFGFLLPTLLRKLKVCSDVDGLLHLFKYFSHYRCQIGESSENATSIFICNLFDTLEEKAMLDSAQALLLYAFANSECWWWESDIDSSCKCVQRDEKLKLVLEKLSELKTRLYVHYQGYVENQDKQKIEDIYKRNERLRFMEPEFTTWYYNGDLKRAQNLLVASRSDGYNYHNGNFIELLHKEMVRLHRMETFDAFCMYNEANNQGLSTIVDLSSIKDMNLGTPNCVRVLLNSSSKDHQLRMVNKYFDEPLSYSQQKRGVFYCKSSEVEKGQLFWTFVDPDTSLTTFLFSFSDAVLKMDASVLDGKTRVASKGTQWMIKPIDDHHVKIFNSDGKYIFSNR